MSEVLTVKRAAERLGVTSHTVQLWIKQGLLPGAYRLNPSNNHSPYRIPVRDVERIEEKRMGTPSA
jgi:excisionase family DNA binding protein